MKINLSKIMPVIWALAALIATIAGNITEAMLALILSYLAEITNLVNKNDDGY